MSRANLEKDPHDVAAMFDGVAPRYDLANDVLSLGQDRIWRRAVRRAVDARQGERVLDLAAGTGTSSRPFADAGAQVVAADFSLGMLAAGTGRRVAAVAPVGADALHLPFADGSFDAVTISFGLRNVNDTDAALCELLRVTRPGGRLVVCEFSTPTVAPVRVVYSRYLMKALPRVARKVGTNGPAYAYLAESIAAWPDQEALARLVVAAGWQRAEWRDLTGGIVALHRARKAL